MRRSLITAVLILLATAMIARGEAPADDADAALATARGKIAELNTRLATLLDTLRQRDLEIDDLNRRLNATIERQQRAAPLIRDAVNEVLNTAKNDLAAATIAAVDAGQVLERAWAAVMAARSDVDRRRAAIERAANDERKAFELSDPYRRASADIRSAEQGLARERSRLEDLLADDATIAPLAQAARDAESAVAAARAATSANDPAIARASALWIAAKNKLSTARAAAYAKDAAFTAAQKTVDASHAARTAMSDVFDRSAMSRPAVVAAQAAYRAAEDLVVSTASAAETARVALGHAAQNVSVRQENVNAVSALVESPESGLSPPR